MDQRVRPQPDTDVHRTPRAPAGTAAASARRWRPTASRVPGTACRRRAWPPPPSSSSASPVAATRASHGPPRRFPGGHPSRLTPEGMPVGTDTMAGRRRGREGDLHDATPCRSASHSRHRAGHLGAFPVEAGLNHGDSDSGRGRRTRRRYRSEPHIALHVIKKAPATHSFRPVPPPNRPLSNTTGERFS